MGYYLAKYKWQPMMAIVSGGRIQCHCGALAVVMNVKVAFDTGKHLSLEDVSFWCQDCYQKETDWPGDEVEA